MSPFWASCKMLYVSSWARLLLSMTSGCAPPWIETSVGCLVFLHTEVMHDDHDDYTLRWWRLRRFQTDVLMIMRIPPDKSDIRGWHLGRSSSWVRQSWRLFGGDKVKDFYCFVKTLVCFKLSGFLRAWRRRHMFLVLSKPCLLPALIVKNSFSFKYSGKGGTFQRFCQCVVLLQLQCCMLSSHSFSCRYSGRGGTSFSFFSFHNIVFSPALRRKPLCSPHWRWSSPPYSPLSPGGSDLLTLPTRAPG